MGKRTARVTLEDIPFRYDVMWAAAAVIFDVEENIEILSTRRRKATGWKGQGLEMIVQAENNTLENLPDRVSVGEGHTIRVSVEGRRPRCFKCGQKGHVRST
uniref:CCHC-type domain-containing protein n=1 Tax=Octopus bimaculoides TaxID=37653 RepID=A0A0L8GL57_OCTBM